MNEENNKVLENEVEETLETTDLVDENENLIEVADMPQKDGFGGVATAGIIAAGAIAFLGLKRGVRIIRNKVKTRRAEWKDFKEWKEATNFDRFDENGNIIDESEEDED
jgi:hypothetical protein